MRHQIETFWKDCRLQRLEVIGRLKELELELELELSLLPHTWVIPWAHYIKLTLKKKHIKKNKSMELTKLDKRISESFSLREWLTENTYVSSKKRFRKGWFVSIELDKQTSKTYKTSISNSMFVSDKMRLKSDSQHLLAAWERSSWTIPSAMIRKLRISNATSCLKRYEGKSQNKRKA